MSRVLGGAHPCLVAAHVLDREVVIKDAAQKQPPEAPKACFGAVNQLVGDDDGRVTGVHAGQHDPDESIHAPEPAVGHQADEKGEVGDLEGSQHHEHGVERPVGQGRRGLAVLALGIITAVHMGATVDFASARETVLALLRAPSPPQ